MVVTDIAARGIDIPLLDVVINYDFPAQPKLFVHRVGRAARAGRSGAAFSFVTNIEIPYMLDLHLYLARPIPGFDEPVDINKITVGDAAVLQNLSAPIKVPMVTSENAKDGDGDDDAEDSDDDEEEEGDGDETIAVKLSEYKEKIQKVQNIPQTVIIPPSVPDCTIGTFEQNMLEIDLEFVGTANTVNSDLNAAHRIQQNAYKLYYKTLTQASQASINRAKEKKQFAIHPIFLAWGLLTVCEGNHPQIF